MDLNTVLYILLALALVFMTWAAHRAIRARKQRKIVWMRECHNWVGSEPPRAPIARHPQPKVAPAPSATSNAPASAPTSSTTDDGIIPVVLVHAVLASNDNHRPAAAPIPVVCTTAYEAPAPSPSYGSDSSCSSSSTD